MLAWTISWRSVAGPQSRAASYAKALAQRNALIGRVRGGVAAQDSLNVWNRELARHGIELMDHRRELVEALAGPFEQRALELGLPAPTKLAYRPRTQRT